ncbi:MAG: hypothetical protein ACLQIH_02640 [Myxococcaceae bacterium]
MHPTSPSPEARSTLAGQLVRAQRLGQEGKNVEALAICGCVLSEAETLGVVSPEAMWTAGVVCDQQGNFQMAVDFCRRAVAADHWTRR